MLDNEELKSGMHHKRIKQRRNARGIDANEF